MPAESMEELVALSKRRGFVFQASEIYGGLQGVYDYGPLGVGVEEQPEERLVARDGVRTRRCGGVGFGDPHQFPRIALLRPRRDFCRPAGGLSGLQVALACRPSRRQVSTMRIGRPDRPASVQSDVQDQRGPRGGWFVVRLPAARDRTNPCSPTSRTSWTRHRQGCPSVSPRSGKAFRNEITPHNFIFRVREFEQMELEFFVEPGTDDDWHERWVQSRLDWWRKQGIDGSRLELLNVPPHELAHYSKATVDIMYRFPARPRRTRGHRQPNRLRPRFAHQEPGRPGHRRRGAGERRVQCATRGATLE